MKRLIILSIWILSISISAQEQRFIWYQNNTGNCEVTLHPYIKWYPEVGGKANIVFKTNFLNYFPSYNLDLEQSIKDFQGAVQIWSGPAAAANMNISWTEWPFHSVRIL